MVPLASGNLKTKVIVVLGLGLTTPTSVVALYQKGKFTKKVNFQCTKIFTNKCNGNHRLGFTENVFFAQVLYKINWHKQTHRNVNNTVIKQVKIIAVI